MAQMNKNGKFTKTEQKPFASGGSLSTPKERMGVPADHFLMPDQRKYPFMVNGKISCDLLRAAQVRAKQNNEPDVAKKAKMMFDSHCV